MTVERYALFVRVSTTKQDDTQQVSELNEHVRSRGGIVAQVYREGLGTSAWRHDTARPELKRALADVQKTPRPWDVLVAFKLDRVTRLGSVEGHALLKTIFDAGARVETLHDSIPWETPIARDILLALTFAIAEQESADISARTKASRQAIRDGLRDGKLGGRPRRLTPEVLERIRQLKEQEPPPTWAKIAQKTGIPAETCRWGYRDLKRRSAENQQVLAGGGR